MVKGDVMPTMLATWKERSFPGKHVISIWLSDAKPLKITTAHFYGLLVHIPECAPPDSLPHRERYLLVKTQETENPPPPSHLSNSTNNYEFSEACSLLISKFSANTCS
jgi:hypothetical protein